MRTICERCHAPKLDPIKNPKSYCAGDMPNCPNVMIYDQGYNAAVEKCCEWVGNHNADPVAVRQLKKAMTNEIK